MSLRNRLLPCTHILTPPQAQAYDHNFRCRSRRTPCISLMYSATLPRGPPLKPSPALVSRRTSGLHMMIKKLFSPCLVYESKLFKGTLMEESLPYFLSRTIFHQRNHHQFCQIVLSSSTERGQCELSLANAYSQWVSLYVLSPSGRYSTLPWLISLSYPLLALRLKVDILYATYHNRILFPKKKKKKKIPPQTKKGSFDI